MQIVSFFREKRASVLWRTLLAFVLLGCARYGVWYVHEQHVAYAAAHGVSDVDELWQHSCDARAPFATYDSTLNVVYPLTHYFASTPRARDALVQFVAAMELLMIVTNVWLFVFYDIWILAQILTAFLFVLCVTSAAWQPMLCDAVRLPLGSAWLSDVLSGELRQLPFTGLSGSTVFMSLGLFNIYEQRRATEVAFLNLSLLVMYIVYHLVLRWHSVLDELFAVVFAWMLVLVLQNLRVMHRVNKLYEAVEKRSSTMKPARRRELRPDHDVIMPLAPPSTPHHHLSLQETLQVYMTHSQLTAPVPPRVEEEDGVFPPEKPEYSLSNEFRRQPLTIYGDSSNVYAT